MGHYQRDFLNLASQCTYCSEVDHTVEECPQLIAKWKAKNVPQPQPNHNTTQNQNPHPNVQKILDEIRIQPVHVIIVTRGELLLMYL